MSCLFLAYLCETLREGRKGEGRREGGEKEGEGVEALDPPVNFTVLASENKGLTMQA